jgi:hypothetical protein
VHNETVHQLFIAIKEVYNLLRREILVLYNILVEFEVTVKLVTMTKMRLNETYSIVCVGKYLSDNFPIQNGLKQGDVLPPLLLNFALECH